MEENKKRCTFAIISHPDAGKTTITEKLLLHGSVIRRAGMVKSKNNDYAKSDWMELEKQRGISITSSVMSFPYRDRLMHLLDTPGHKDFSEDTYRTLTAVESVLMMIDSAKGVEAQTVKLMEVCRLRDTPIITFMNKFDRDSLSPFELIDNIESVLSIQAIPMTWPIGDGVTFKGVYNFATKKIILFSKNDKDFTDHTVIDGSNISSQHLTEYLDPEQITKLKEDLEMVEGLIPPFSIEEFLAGIQTPVFFGSALFDFGVNETLDMIADIAPPPLPKKIRLFPYDEHAEISTVNPDNSKFSGFIFKIQANMDKGHRDRMAFLRVCSGTFVRNQKIFHVRSEKDIKISSPVIFQARDREIADTATAGDIIGLHDTGKFQIGDTFTEGRKFSFIGIPSFAPELFMQILLKDPMKMKQLTKGLLQLSEEGTVQLFRRHTSPDKIMGAVGMLQFEVVKFRLEDEYNVKGDYTPYPFIGIRWLQFESDENQEQFIKDNAINIVYDNKEKICFAVRSEWDLKLIQEKNPNVFFFNNSDYSNIK